MLCLYCFKHLFSTLFQSYRAASPSVNGFVKSLANFTLDKMFAVPKLEAFANDKVNVMQGLVFVFDRIEKKLETKRKCCVTTYFSQFIMFSKAFFHMVMKTLDCSVPLTLSHMTI